MQYDARRPVVLARALFGGDCLLPLQSGRIAAGAHHSPLHLPGRVQREDSERDGVFEPATLRAPGRGRAGERRPRHHALQSAAQSASHRHGALLRRVERPHRTQVTGDAAVFRHDRRCPLLHVGPVHAQRALPTVRHGRCRH